MRTAYVRLLAYVCAAGTRFSLSLPVSVLFGLIMRSWWWLISELTVAVHVVVVVVIIGRSDCLD